uniref:Uncharacterized protein n=1 Tax=Muribaculaceae bacterium Z82 TaxID=2304548 RepID=A0A7C9NBE9_9BACT
MVAIAGGLVSCSAPKDDGIAGLPVDESAFDPLPAELTYEASEQVRQQVVAAAPAVLGEAGLDIGSGAFSLGNPIQGYRVRGTDLVKLAADLWPVYRGDEYVGYLAAATYDDEKTPDDSAFRLSRWKSSVAEDEVAEGKTAYSDYMFVPRTSGAAERYVERMLTREGACAYVGGFPGERVISPDEELVIMALMPTDEEADMERLRTAEEVRSHGLRYGSIVGRIPLK